MTDRPADILRRTIGRDIAGHLLDRPRCDASTLEALDALASAVAILIAGPDRIRYGLWFVRKFQRHLDGLDERKAA